MKIKSIHHLELWVENTNQAAYYYRNAPEFSRFAYSGLETGNREVTTRPDQGRSRSM